jgi:hypothetical protein
MPHEPECPVKGLRLVEAQNRFTAEKRHQILVDLQQVKQVTENVT